MASDSTSGVFRRSSLRYYPYASGTGYGKKGMKEEVVRLGVKLSVSLAESMFLLCDDIRTMLWFCYKLWRHADWYRNSDSPVVERLLRVSHYVNSKYIEPKNRLFQDGGNSGQWELISTSWNDFADGVIVLHRLVLLLRRKGCSFDDRLLSSAIAKYKQVLKKLDDKLRSAEDVSEANGFARQTIESNIFYLWRSLFDEEASKATPKVTKNRILNDLFKPLLDESRQSTSGFISHSEILALPIYSPYILGEGFAKQELKEEVVRLGVELSLSAVESMFLLCDDIRSILWFCFKLWRDALRNQGSDSPVSERLLRVIYHVYSKYIKPKYGVYQNGGRSAQWRLSRTTWENFSDVIRDLILLVLILRGGGESCLDGREFTTRIEGALKKVEEKLSCAKAVSQANGFAREAMESDIMDLWKSLFDKEAKEATLTQKAIKNGILIDLFLPLSNEAAPP